MALLFDAPTIPTMFVRFICVTVLHLTMVEQTNQHLNMMKFSLNHPYLFDHSTMTFLIIFVEYLISICIELANIAVLLTTGDTISLISNFVAIVIVAEFDHYVFESMKDEPFKKLVSAEFTEDVLKIRHTTSKKCSEKDFSDEKDIDGQLRPLKVSWLNRSNKIAWFFYASQRIFYVAIYFYFLPLIAMIVNGYLPIYFVNNGLTIDDIQCYGPV